MNNRLKGLSLSFCVRDILNGIVNIQEVAFIETSTLLKTESDWENAINLYSKVYWNNLEEEATKIVNTLRKTNRIFQPRLNGYEERSILEGHWVVLDEVGRELKYFHPENIGFKIFVKK